MLSNVHTDVITGWLGGVDVMHWIVVLYVLDSIPMSELHLVFAFFVLLLLRFYFFSPII